uniref:FLYWCH-type domain-containing protein n=1 Tax=Panagrellus redivivus TaxID=6233 RepID=A0A7E5A025_PANRE
MNFGTDADGNAQLNFSIPLDKNAPLPRIVFKPPTIIHTENETDAPEISISIVIRQPKPAAVPVQPVVVEKPPSPIPVVVDLKQEPEEVVVTEQEQYDEQPSTSEMDYNPRDISLLTPDAVDDAIERFLAATGVGGNVSGERRMDIDPIMLPRARGKSGDVESVVTFENEDEMKLFLKANCLASKGKSIETAEGLRKPYKCLRRNTHKCPVTASVNYAGATCYAILRNQHNHPLGERYRRANGVSDAVRELVAERIASGGNLRALNIQRTLRLMGTPETMINNISQIKNHVKHEKSKFKDREILLGTTVDT